MDVEVVPIENEAVTPDGVVRCSVYGEGKLVRDFRPEDVEGLELAPGQFVWIGLHEPPPELLRRIQKRFGLHELAVEDAMRAHQRPKVEEFADSFFVVVKTADWDEKKRVMNLGETHIFVGHDYVVSVRHGPSLPHAPVRQRAEAAPHLLARGPGYVLYALLDFIVDNYFPLMDELEESVEQLEAKLFSGPPKPKITKRIYALRRELGVFKRVVLPLLDCLHKLMRIDSRLIPEDIRLYFRDVYDHVVRLNESTDQLREIVHSALEANLALISVRQNDTMQMLAAWAAILALPTLIAGIWGMNVNVWPNDQTYWGFGAILVLMAVTCSGLWLRFRRIGWL